MKKHLRKHFLSALLCCTLFTACKKDPGTWCPPPQPDALLTEVRTIYRYEGDVPVSYAKTLDRYQYNGFHKPWLHIRMISGADTTQLIESRVDTLYYDHLQRVVKVVGYEIDHWRRVSLRKFYYNGTERMPARAEYEEQNDEWTNIPASARYVWGDTVVLQITGTDTSRVIYNRQGNFLGWNDFLDYRYDNLPNAERYFNLEHGLALNAPNNYAAVVLPRYARNNWTENGNFTFRIQRFTYPDHEGRVGQIYWRDQLRGDLVADAYYTYTLVQ